MRQVLSDHHSEPSARTIRRPRTWVEVLL
jgi:hypothetical protein